MLEKILNLVQKLDLKWWISLKAQQMLTILMAVLIVVFFSTTVMLFVQNQNQAEKDRIIRNEVRDSLQAKIDACQESKYRIVEKYEILHYEGQVIKEELKSSLNEKINP